MTIAEQAVIDYGSLVLEDRVHGSVYTDPAIFAAEMRIIFGRGWVFVGHESEIPEPGDFKLSNIGAQPAIMSRDESGTVHVLMNRCAHRAATVCQEERGNCRFFKCAYHHWTYRTDGELVAVPFPGGYDETFDKSDFGLAKAPRVGDYRGFLFASLNPEVADLDEHLGDLVKEQIDLFLDLSPTGEIDCRAGTIRFRFKGNWKLQLENTADGYHINFLHESLLSVLKERQGLDIHDMNSDSSAALNVALGRGHTLMDMRPYNRMKPSVRDGVLKGGGPQAEYIAAMERAYGPERADEIIVSGGTHLGVWPNLGVLAGLIRRIQPISVDETEVILTPALLKGAPDVMNAGRLRGQEGFFPPAGMGGTDDQEVFERVQAGLQAEVNPWLLIARGMNRELTRPDGSIASQVTDETNTRAIFQHWKHVMATSS